MVLIDTSVWIDLFRNKQNPLGELVWALTAKNDAAICGQVLVEFVGGFRKSQERRDYEDSFTLFPFLETSPKAYKLAANLLGDFPHLGSGDAIIAATAIDNRAPLLTLDKGFNRLTKIGLVLYPG